MSSNLVVKGILAIALSCSMASGALADDCAGELAEADTLVHAVRLREPDIDARHAKGDVEGTCELLRANFADMTKARGQMERCMTGYEKRENLGQMDVSLDDLGHVIGSYCG